VTLPSPPHAEEAPSGLLRVVRPLLHAQQEEAELCLEFDRPLDAIGTIARNTAALRLEADGKNIAVTDKNISLGGNQLCLSPLEHRKDYTLAVGALQNAKGEKISQPYSLSLSVPARHPALVFVSKEGRDGLTVWRENPVLHSVNSAKVTLELYRITDPAKMAEAWNQRLQTTLAPSESLYFARANGTLVWKGALTPEQVLDKSTISKIDFAQQGTADFSPGLYLLAASDPDAKPAKKDGLSKDEQDKENTLTPTAAAWLLRSNLILQALRDDKVYRAFAAVSDASAVAQNVHILALDSNQQILAEAWSDVSGQAQLAPKPDKNNEAQTLLGVSDKGDVAFVDLSRDATPNPALPSMTASLVVDQPVYAPNETINVALTARDLHKHAVDLKGSALQILRPDHSLYVSQAVMLDPNGAARLSLAAPVSSGLWHLVWKQGDQITLAETVVRVSANPAAPELNVTADRTSLAADGGVNLTIRSQTGAKTAAPYVAGHVELAWEKPEHPFAAWKEYIFDDGKKIDATAKPIGFFLTDAKGFAHMHVESLATNTTPALRQARLSVVGNPALATLDPDALVLPVKPADITLGLKPRAARGHFPENSLAHFDVVALDGDGQRRAITNLTYQIYEEGRSFDWFQSEGHWDYKPQQQRRRIGGGSLSIAGDGKASVEWPVTSGSYRMEITNADGVLLACLDFNAGWGFSDKEKVKATPLELTAASPVVSIGREDKISFTLTRPALVTAIVADDRMRSVTHGAYPAGANSISIVPAGDWGSHIVVQVQAKYGAGDDSSAWAVGQLLLSSGIDAAPVAFHAKDKPVSSAKTNVAVSAKTVLQETSRQRLAPQQSRSMATNKQHASTAAQFVFVAPEPFFDAPTLLSAALNQHPITTKEIARQLETTRLWRDAILSAKLVVESELRARQNDLLMRLLSRQKADGSFAPLPGRDAGDIGSTTAAVEALNLLGDAAARPASEQAITWLRHSLENTWFGEDERPLRASIYAALAGAEKLDLASLHYFSDTSADKPLPPLAAAQLAYAFASINDKAASGFWLDKARDGGGDKASFTAEALAVLFANPYFAPREAQASLENASKYASASLDSGAVSDFLLALWRSEDRAGAWRVGVGKDEISAQGMLVLSATDKVPVALRNPSQERALYLAVTTAVKAPDEKAAGQRRVYNLDGGEVKGRLKRGAVYLVMVEGAWPEDKRAGLVAHENPTAMLSPITCAIEAPSADGFLGWLAYKTPTAVAACEKSADGLDVYLTRGEKDPAAWRMTYLAKANGGEEKALRPTTAEAIANPNPDDKDVRR
jgi:uncharacterized protein YfaS (alpha-2-macroglobulin family)